MLDDIKKIIPKMENSDAEFIYKKLNDKKKEKRNFFSNKFVYAIASFVALLAICIPVGIKMFDRGGNNPDPDIWEEGPDIDEGVPNYNLQGTTIEFYDCYVGEDSDVLVLWFPDITLIDIYIKEASSYVILPRK